MSWQMWLPWFLSSFVAEEGLAVPETNGGGGDRRGQRTLFCVRWRFFVEEKDCMDVLWINGMLPRRSCMDKVGTEMVWFDTEENAIHKLSTCGTWSSEDGLLFVFWTWPRLRSGKRLSNCVEGCYVCGVELRSSALAQKSPGQSDPAREIVSWKH